MNDKASIEFQILYFLADKDNSGIVLDSIKPVAYGDLYNEIYKGNYILEKSDSLFEKIQEMKNKRLIEMDQLVNIKSIPRLGNISITDQGIKVLKEEIMMKKTGWDIANDKFEEKILGAIEKCSEPVTCKDIADIITSNFADEIFKRVNFLIGDLVVKEKVKPIQKDNRNYYSIKK